jgi:hypothetical protein
VLDEYKQHFVQMIQPGQQVHEKEFYCNKTILIPPGSGRSGIMIALKKPQKA